MECDVVLCINFQVTLAKALQLILVTYKKCKESCRMPGIQAVILV